MNATKFKCAESDIITIPMAQKKSNLGYQSVMKIAKESDSLIRLGRVTRVYYPKFESYLLREYTTRE